MSKKKNTGKPKSSFKLGIIFFAVFLTVLSISLTIKSVIIIKNSKFDGLHRFTIAFNEKSNAKVLSFSPENRTISLLTVRGGNSSKSLSTLVRIPLESIITDDSLDIQKNNVFSSILKVLVKHKNKDSAATVFDLVRLAYFAKTLPLTSFYEETIDQSTDPSEVDKIATSLFTDTSMTEERKTIEIVNTTGATGLGNRLAISLSNLGANVVLVSNSEKVQEKSKIMHSGDRNYTVQKLSSILGIKSEIAGRKDIADIIIILGKDLMQSERF